MSGLCGIVDFSETPSADVLHRMLFMIRHRGCGDPRIWTNPHIALGHWDLQTLEPNRRGEQPWWDRPSGTVVAADARLDNRDEIRSGLGLAEATDPELITCGYRNWGQNLFTRIVGDFAIAVWDDRNQTLLLARDPIGVKPLYYCSIGTRLLFASEAKAILAVPGVPRAPEALRLEEMKNKRFRLRDHTFFRNVYRVWPGECILFDRHGLRRWAFWTPDLHRRICYSNSEQYQSEFRRLFFEAVRCRLPKAGRAGMMLSGGMDSSAVACVASDIHRRERPEVNIRTYTYLSTHFPDPLESTLDVTASTGFLNRTVDIDSIHLTHRMQDRVFDQETPFLAGDVNIHHRLFQYVADRGDRILLTGSGGDELMQSRAFLADLFIQGRWGRLMREIAGVRSYYGPLTPQFLKYALWYLVLPRRATPRFRSRSAKEVYEGLLEPLRLAGREEMERQAACCGLELRSPFMDLRLAEFVLAIPGEERASGGEPKMLLRQSLRDLIPAPVLRRPKRLDDSPHLQHSFARSDLQGATLEQRFADFQDQALKSWSEIWFGRSD